MAWAQLADGVYTINNAINNRGTMCFGTSGGTEYLGLTGITYTGLSGKSVTVTEDANKYWYVQTVNGTTYIYNIGKGVFLKDSGADVATSDSNCNGFTLVTKSSGGTSYISVMNGSRYLTFSPGYEASAGQVRWRTQEEADAVYLTFNLVDNGTTTYKTQVTAAITKIKIFEAPNALNEFDPNKLYAVATPNRGGWAVSGDRFVSTAGAASDWEDTNQQFAVLEKFGNYYLYSVAANKFVKSDGSLVAGRGSAIEFIDASAQGTNRVVVKFKGASKYVNINDERSVVINGWSTADGGNAVVFLYAGEFDSTDAIDMLGTSTEYVHNETPRDNDRKLSSFTITDDNSSVTVSDIQTSNTSPVYVDKTDNVLKTVPGATLSFSAFSYSGTWMHAYAYIDYNKDYRFNLTNNNDGTGNGEIVSYNYFDGNNILGVSVPQGNAIAKPYGENNTGISKGMPEFTLPANLALGEYRMRVKVDWNNIDADFGASDIAGNGGCQCDITIKVTNEFAKAELGALVEQLNAYSLGAEVGLYSSSEYSLDELNGIKDFYNRIDDNTPIAEIQEYISTLTDALPTVSLNLPEPGYYTIACGGKYVSDDKKSAGETQRVLTTGEVTSKNIFYYDGQALIGYASGCGFEYACCNTGKEGPLNFFTFYRSTTSESEGYLIKSSQGNSEVGSAEGWGDGFWKANEGDYLERVNNEAAASLWTLTPVTMAAQIGEQVYYTLDEAKAAALATTEAVEIVLLAGSDATIVFPANVTINKNGFTADKLAVAVAKIGDTLYATLDAAKAAALATTEAVEIVLLAGSDEAIVFPANVTINKNGFTADKLAVAVAKIGDVLYATLADAAAAAQAGQTVVLLKDTEETLVLPAGVKLDKSNVTAPYVNEAAAKIGDTLYATLADAAADAQAGQTVTILRSTEETAVFAYGVVIERAEGVVAPNATNEVAVDVPADVVGDIVNNSGVEAETVNGVVGALQNNEAVISNTPTNLPDGAKLVVTLVNIIFESEAPAKVVYDVTPKNGDAEVEPTEKITFRLPVPANWKYAKVYHAGTALEGIYPVKEGNYVEVASQDFSEFAVEIADPVAKIGDVDYYTFEAALADAQAGETITLVADVTCTEKPVFTKGGVVNVDINGHKFVSSEKARVRCVASADGAVASNNIKFVRGFGWEIYYKDNADEKFRVFPTLDEAVAYKSGTNAANIYPYEDVVQGKDITFRTTGEQTSTALTNDAGYKTSWDLNGFTVLQETAAGNPLESTVLGEFTLLDSSAEKTGKWIAGAYNGNTGGGPAFIVNRADAHLILQGGTISIARNGDVVNTDGLINTNYGTLTVDGATLQCDDTYGVMAWGGNVVVNSGKFVMGENGAYSVFASKYYADASVEVNTAIDGYLLISSTATATVNVPGVKYVADGTDYLAPDVAEGLVAQGGVVGYPVAKIGEAGYLTLKAAVAAAQDGDVVTLVNNVALETPVVISGKALTLDLGAYTIEDKSTAVLTKDDNVWALIDLKNGANLTVRGTGTIKANYAEVQGGWTGMAYCINVDNTSKLTVDGGNFINGNGGVQTRGEVVVNDGTFVPHNGGTCIMAIYTDAKVTVNGGTFKDSVEESDVYTGSGAVWAGFGAKIEIKGGTFDFAADPEHGNVVWTLFPAQNAIAGTGVNAEMTVSGGTFVNFNPAKDVVVGFSPSTGFTFGSVVAEGYAVVDNGDGTYGVVVDPAYGKVAKVGDAYYATIAEAVAAAQAGQTVTLLADINLSEILVLDKAITLDGNDKTLTSTAGRAINVSGADGVTIKNLTINASGERAINVIQNATNVTIDNVTATAANYTVNVATSAPNAVVAIKNSTLNGLCTVNVSAAGADVTIDNCTVNCNDNNTTTGEAYAALSLNKDAVGGSIVATNTTVNVTDGSDSMKGRNSAENGTVSINGSTDDVTVMVAVITYEGSTNYYSFETLAAAVEYAKAGDVVTLIRDITASDFIAINKAITLDLNGKKVTSTAKKAFEVHADATIKNGAIEAAQRCVDTRKAVELTLTDVTLIADEYTTHGNPQPLTIGGSENGTKVVMINVNISAAAGYGIITFVETELTATNSTIGGYNALYVKSGSDNSTFNFVDSDLSGSTLSNDVEGNSFSVIAVRANNVTVNVDDASTVTAKGNYSYAISFTGPSENATGSSVTVAGEITGNILDDPNGNTVKVKAEYADELAAAGYATIEAEDGLVAVIKPVAKIGDTQFETLSEAVDAAQAGDEIVLLSDVELTESLVIAAGKEVVLDLNGKTVSMADASGKGAYAIKNNGNLTIVDNSDAETGKITFNSTTPDNSFGYATSTIGNGGSLTVESGTIENTTVGGASYAIDGIWHTDEASLTINGGTIVANKIAVRQVPFSATANNVVTVNGGTLTGATAGLQLFNINNDAKLAEVNIHGGEFNGSYAFYTSFTSAAASKDVTINIDGGEFNGYLYLYNGKNGSDEYPMTVSVTDGTFNGGAYIYTTDANGDEVAIPSITGGTFANDVTVYCADGFICEANGDGTYGIVEAPKDPEVVDGKIEFIDGEFDTFVNAENVANVDITYKRTLRTSWVALYVPFEIPMSMLLEKFEVAYFNDVHSYDDDHNGTIDRMSMELVDITNSNATLRANYPYFIRAKSAENTALDITLEDATLYADDENSVDCTSMYHKFEITGTHKRMTRDELGDRRVVNTEGEWVYQSSTGTLKPFRFYLTITNRNGSPVEISENAQMSVVVRGEDGTTGIDGIYGDENGETVIFDLYGRRVLEPEKGNIYIINGKKVLVK